MSNTTRRTRPRGEARRRQILDVASRLFAERGYHKVGIAEIAAETGISQAGLLHHYPSKQDLLLAVLAERDDRGAANRERTGAGLISDFLEGLRRNEREPQLVQLFAILSAESISLDHPSHEWFVNRYTTLIDEMTDAVAEVVDPSKLPDGVDARLIAQWVIGLADGIRIQSLLKPGSVNRADAVEKLIELLRPYART